MNQIAYKFVSWDVPALESLAGSKAYILRKRLNDGGTLTREEKDWITREVNHNTYFKDSIPLLGYRFNFVDVLKTFVVKQYGHYTEYKGVDKTSIRSMLYGRVERIVAALRCNSLPKCPRSFKPLGTKCSTHRIHVL